METQTVYSFKPTEKFASVASKSDLKRVGIFLNTNTVTFNKAFKTKAEVQKFIDAGFNVTQQKNGRYVINDNVGTIVSTEVGPVVNVKSVKTIKMIDCTFVSGFDVNNNKTIDVIYH